MKYWSLDDIPWQQFDRDKTRPDLISLVKAACMVEHNGHDYARYLCEVFQDDPEFQAVAKEWAEEEVQHGEALRRWAELADPAFNFEESFHRFTTGYRLPENVSASIRGSKSGELIARCVVETGTSSYYTAIRESTDEPVLSAICARIAADELRHYKLFYTYLKRYLATEKVNRLKRFLIALSRIAESEDDELSYAFYAAHNADGARQYEAALYRKRYLACAYALYRKPHIVRMTAMIFKAIGLKPHSWFSSTIDSLAWAIMCRRTALLKNYKQQVMMSAA